MAVTVRSIGPVARSASGDMVVENPAGVQDGDLLITIIVKSANVASNNASWISLTGANTGTGSFFVQPFARTASSEPASYTWLSAGNPRAGVTIAFAGAELADQIGSTPLARARNNASTANGVASVNNDELNALVVGLEVTNGLADFSSWAVGTAGAMTEFMDVDASSTYSFGGAAVEQAATGATGALSVTITPATANVGMLFTISPAPVQTAAATIDGTSSFTAAGTVTSGPVTHNAAASFSGSASLAATAVYERLAASAVAGTSTLQAGAFTEQFAAALLSGVGSVAGSAVVTGGPVQHFGATAIAGVGNITASGRRTQFAGALVPGVGAIVAEGIVTVPGSFIAEAVITATSEISAGGVYESITQDRATYIKWLRNMDYLLRG